MGDIVELGNNIVQELGSGESMNCLDLRTEMTKDNHGWHLWSNEDRTDQKLKVL